MEFDSRIKNKYVHVYNKCTRILLFYIPKCIYVHNILKMLSCPLDIFILFLNTEYVYTIKEIIIIVVVVVVSFVGTDAEVDVLHNNTTA